MASYIARSKFVSVEWVIEPVVTEVTDILLQNSKALPSSHDELVTSVSSPLLRLAFLWKSILCVRNRYLDMCDPSTLGPYVARHGPFFSLCQSVFYIFVFRHQSLVEMENGESLYTLTQAYCGSPLCINVGLTFLRSLNFERIISSKLNPLQVSYRLLFSLSLWMCVLYSTSPLQTGLPSECGGKVFKAGEVCTMIVGEFVYMI